MKYENWIRLEEKRLNKKKLLILKPGLGLAGKPPLSKKRAPNREALPSRRRHPFINSIRSLWGM
jgi:hypothetical protein